jgi:hypothetical protein
MIKKTTIICLFGNHFIFLLYNFMLIELAYYFLIRQKQKMSS